MKETLLVVFYSLLSYLSLGQDVKSRFINSSPIFTDSPSLTISIKALKIGDEVPNISLGEIIGAPYKRASISDFKNRLLILDFWSTFCKSCINQFPKMAALQEKFRDRITILPVGFNFTDSNGGDIRKYVHSVMGTKKELKLPTAIQRTTDSVLGSLFPSIGLPWEIWIKDGRVIGITDHLAVTESNIRNIIEERNTKLVDRSQLRSFDWSLPFIINSKINGNTNGAFGSAFSRFIENILPPNGTGFSPDTSQIRFVVVNRTFYYYYWLAYKDSIQGLSEGGKRVIIEPIGKAPYEDGLADPATMDAGEYEKYRNENLFSYEVILSSKYSKVEFKSILISDLDRFFKVKSCVENRSMKCFALIRNTKDDKLYSKYKYKPGYQFDISDDKSKIGRASCRERV